MGLKYLNVFNWKQRYRSTFIYLLFLGSLFIIFLFDFNINDKHDYFIFAEPTNFPTFFSLKNFAFQLKRWNSDQSSSFTSSSLTQFKALVWHGHITSSYMYIYCLRSIYIYLSIYKLSFINPISRCMWCVHPIYMRQSNRVGLRNDRAMADGCI